MHPGVMEAAVIGVPDEEGGETVVAYVVRKDPTLTARPLRNFCRENLTATRCRSGSSFVTRLPKSNVGKVLRRVLKDEVAGVH